MLGMPVKDYVTSVLIGDQDQGVFYPVKIKDAQIRWRENPGVKIQRLGQTPVCFHKICVILTEPSYKPWLPKVGPMVHCVACGGPQL